jgi:hypothetical protein
MKKDKKNITNINQNNDQTRLGQPSKPINKVMKRDNITKKKKKNEESHKAFIDETIKISLKQA